MHYTIRWFKYKHKPPEFKLQYDTILVSTDFKQTQSLENTTQQFTPTWEEKVPVDGSLRGWWQQGQHLLVIVPQSHLDIYVFHVLLNGVLWIICQFCLIFIYIIEMAQNVKYKYTAAPCYSSTCSTSF